MMRREDIPVKKIFFYLNATNYEDEFLTVIQFRKTDKTDKILQ